MLVIRFFRIGKKNQPSFKIVVTDKRKSSVKGRYVEEVGFLDPLKDKKFLRAERIKYWISKGAKPSSTVHNLLISEKIIEGKKISKFKKSKKKEEKPAAAEITKTKEEKPAEVTKPKEEKSTEAKPTQETKVEEKPKEKVEKKAPEKAPETPKKAEAPKASEAKPVEAKPVETKSAATPEKKPETKQL
jgi:small subunit ribosomal protein S16